MTKRIREEISKYGIMDEFFLFACKYLSEYNDSEITKQDAIFANQTKAIKALEDEIRELGRLRYSGRCDDEFYDQEKSTLEQRLKLLRKKFDEQEDFNTQWRSKADKFFNFARYAKEDFESDDDEKKRDVLATIGQNLMFKDGKLVFEPIKYLVPVAETKDFFETQLSKVKTSSKQRKEAAFGDLVSQWYRLPDVLRTEYHQVIIQISRELRVAKEYLGNGLPELGLSAT